MALPDKIWTMNKEELLEFLEEACTRKGIPFDLDLIDCTDIEELYRYAIDNLDPDLADRHADISGLKTSPCHNISAGMVSAENYDLLSGTKQGEHPDDPIIFIFEGVCYRCPASAYRINRILIDKGRVLAAKSWFHGLPRRPYGLHVIEVLPLAEKL